MKRRYKSVRDHEAEQRDRFDAILAEAIADTQTKIAAAFTRFEIKEKTP